MVNVCAVKKAVELHKHVVQNYIAIELDKLIKIGLSSSAATLKVVIKLKGLYNEHKM